jgi:hypothetical protein
MVDAALVFVVGCRATLFAASAGGLTITSRTARGVRGVRACYRRRNEKRPRAADDTDDAQQDH